MQKKRIPWFTLLVSGLLVVVTACGFLSSANTSATPTVPAGEGLYVLSGYASAADNSAGQQIIGFHPGNTDASPVVTLPNGLISQDHLRIYTATSQQGSTTVTITNTQNGATLRTFTFAGSYSTAGQNYTTSDISADGQWLALRQAGQTTTSTIALIDTQAGKLVQTIRLHGNFDLDAVSPDGSRVYLLERLNAGHYHVRYYDVAKGQLYENVVIDKQDLSPNMVGSALTRQMAYDGTVAYTLYTEPRNNMAFVHILPLNDLPLARCIDLPAGTSANLLQYYTLTLSPDGNTLYAANGALGLVSAIIVKSPNALNAKVSMTEHFAASAANVVSSWHTQYLYNGAVLSPDQKILYVVGLHGILALNATNLHVQTSYLTQQQLTGIAISRNGHTLYAVSPASGITTIDVTTGQTQHIVQRSVHAPWGIAWISN